ncbi:hypothetical protein FHX42_003194 [Saccharopolyspora lacisalsi]|uniref:Uncharacterized protein n=1 Tax=Halosaccharopolyspora lacisalsi TaxID=1000566 RepID=A0A839E4I4_9PSEU|nr:hypothetical protein [Halosaccharopolyspora lacisalsi]
MNVDMNAVMPGQRRVSPRRRGCGTDRAVETTGHARFGRCRRNLDSRQRPPDRAHPADIFAAQGIDHPIDVMTRCPLTPAEAKSGVKSGAVPQL